MFQPTASGTPLLLRSCLTPLQVLLNVAKLSEYFGDTQDKDEIHKILFLP